MSDAPIIVWFRRDLRVSDHPALSAAQATGRPVIPLFILDEVVETLGAAAKWRMGLGIDHFQKTIAKIGSKLILRRGKAVDVLLDLIAETGAGEVYWSRAYDPASIARDTEVKANLKGISFMGHLLYEPWLPKTKVGENFKVYTPFWRHVRAGFDIDAPLPAVTHLCIPSEWPKSDVLLDWKMSANMHRGSTVVAKFVHVGERAAVIRLNKFLDTAVEGYKSDRDFPMKPATSGLSENLTYGEISPRTVFNAGQLALEQGKQGAEHFLKELVWREFAYHLLWNFPKLDEICWRREWEDFSWRGENSDATAWKQGRTGQSFVDAGMRELYTTGTMHNRLRMIVGSYLTKHLQTDWRVGLKWFEDCLIDWDPAANAMGWQWIAGCGPDAAPYFRVFNPGLQSEKFDKDEGYRNTWLHTGKHVNAQAFFDAIPISWELTPDTKNITEIIELSQGRKRALDAYSFFKERQTQK